MNEIDYERLLDDARAAGELQFEEMDEVRARTLAIAKFSILDDDMVGEIAIEITVHNRVYRDALSRQNWDSARELFIDGITNYCWMREQIQLDLDICVRDYNQSRVDSE